ncbi:MAG TPA: T9SS type A sorting domain-containing protein [Arachidicoccus sp.]
MSFHNSASMVPLALVSFDGSLHNGTVQLQWKSGIESELSYFEIEKSTDSKTYSPVAKITLQGNNSSYTYTLAQTSNTEYYRLSLVSKDGDNVYSNILPMIQQNQIHFSVYPNPSTDYIYIYNEIPNELHIYSAAGILLHSSPLLSGKNKLSIKSLNAGLYFGVAGSQKFKFIKR